MTRKVMIVVASVLSLLVGLVTFVPSSNAGVVAQPGSNNTSLFMNGYAFYVTNAEYPYPIEQPNVGTWYLSNNVNGVSIENGDQQNTNVYNSTRTNAYDWKVAYALNKYANYPYSNWAAALNFYIGMTQNGGLGYNSRPSLMNILYNKVQTDPFWATQKDVFNYAYNRIRTDVETNAGPYTYRATINGDVTAKTGDSGTVNNVGINTGSGAWLPGIPITLTLSNGRFISNNSNTLTITSATVPRGGYTWRATGSADVSVRASYGPMITNRYLRYTPSNSAQMVLTASPPIYTQYYSDPVPVKVAASPTIDSSSTKNVTGPSTSIADQIAVSGGNPTRALNVSATVHGPYPDMTFASGPGTALGTVTGSGTFDASGNSTITTTNFTVGTNPGYYTFVESLAASPYHNAVSGTFGREVETTLVVNPSVSTSVTDTNAIVGQTISDSVTFSNIFTDVPNDTEDVAYSLTGALYGPVAPLGDGSCPTGAAAWSGAAVAQNIPATAITANGTIDGIGAHEVSADGCYSYGLTLTATHAGNTLVTVQHEVGQSSETSKVTTPVVTTQTSAAQVNIGESVSDDITISKANDSAGDIEIYLWGPVTPLSDASGNPTCTGVDWSTASATPVYTQTGLAHSGDGTYTSGTHTFGETPGCFTWTEVVNYSDSTHTTTTLKGEANEVVLVLAPTANLTGTVFIDGDGDGVKDSFDDFMSGASVTITRSDGGNINGSPSVSVTTNTSGVWSVDLPMLINGVKYVIDYAGSEPTTTAEPYSVDAGPGQTVSVDAIGVELPKSMTVTKTADVSEGGHVKHGTNVTWTYTVENTGDVRLTNVVITDDKLGQVCTITSLAPGATDSCTSSGAV